MYSGLGLSGQSSEAIDYWQQEVDYRIDVTLDDEAHTLKGYLEFDYSNNSPDDLEFIYVHLWPNAFKDLNTPFSKQQLEHGHTDFYFGKSEDRGYIKDLSFKIGDKALVMESYQEHEEACKVLLDKPLKSGESITISTPFFVKIPKSVSRLGHTGQAYQITQWYPKPAVYDKNGWNVIPNLTLGEFYSEFGSFDVSVTLPKNYVVGATGELQNEEEIAWLDAKAAETAKIENYGTSLEFPVSDTETKTLRYKQDRIHDFAWFADKRFHVLKGEVKLPNSDRTVTTWAMYTNDESALWANSLEYLHDATYAYSLWVGEYPFNHVTALQSTLSAGAGMEYPMITVIGPTPSARLLDRVICHEVGHNWFYGILGSNERAFPWMDEGMNCFYESRYMVAKYPIAENPPIGNEQLSRFFDIGDLDKFRVDELTTQVTERTCSHQPIAAHSTEYTELNYAAILYSKAPYAFRYLEQFLGRSEFDRIMQKYYETWKYKHPQPEDFRALMEKESGKYLDWFFDELMTTKAKVDIKICDVHKHKQKIGEDTFDEITVHNKLENVKGPYSISGLKDGQIVHTAWYDPFADKDHVLFPTGDYDELRVDAIRAMPETNRQNNNYRYNGLFPKVEKLRLQPLFSLENPERTQLFFSPIAGFNYHDQAMLGIGLYNSFIPARKFQWQVAPMYGLGSREFVGTGAASYTITPDNSWLQNVQLRLGANRFTYNLRTRIDSLDVPREAFTYLTLKPSITFNFQKSHPKSKRSSSLTFLHHNLRYEDRNKDTIDSRFAVKNRTGYFNEIAYELRNNRSINPLGLRLALRQGSMENQERIGTVNDLGFVLASISADYKITFDSKSRGSRFRVFAGYFLQNDRNARVMGLSGTSGGATDPYFEHLYLGRNNTLDVPTFYQQQIYHQFGGFRLPSVLGRANQYMFSLNFDSSIPRIKLPLKVFADIGYASSESSISLPGNETILYDAGLALVILPDVLEVYFPLLIASDFQDNLDINQKTFKDRISFVLNITDMSPFTRIAQLTR